MLVAMILLGMAALAKAKLSDMGVCIPVQTDESFVLADFAADGRWSYVKVPLTGVNCDLEKMYLEIEPSTSQPGSYDTTIYVQYESEDPKVFIKETSIDSFKGHTISTATVGGAQVEFKMSFLKYVAGRYAYFTVCSNDGGNMNIDYRFVVAHGELWDEEKKAIAEIESKYAFKGELKDISI